MSRASLTCALMLLGGCGLTLDLDPPDEPLEAGPRDAGPRDAGPRDAGIRDAGPLGRCGDGVVNAGEDCDDGNDTSNDGCEPDCTFTCQLASDCAVADPRCSTVACVDQICVPGPISSSECEIDDGVTGQCIGGRCIPTTCGNGVVDEGEECDDQNNEPADGCEPDCTFACDLANDGTARRSCSDGIACNGVEVCRANDDGVPVCAEAEVVPPHYECLECDLVSGEWRLIDQDGDGYASVELACDERGGDCNDADPRIHPGAPDLSVPGNGVDDDCDGRIDEDIVTICLRDADGDGYGAREGSMTAGPDAACPDGWMPAPDASSIRYDCDDGNADVFPGQTLFFVHPRPGCTGDLCWDYDCDGAHQRRWPREAQCLAILGRECDDEGWSFLSGLVVPDCGASGTWTTCRGNSLLCAPALVGTSRAQQCR